MLLPVRLKHDDPPLRLNGERISQGAVQRALPPVGEHPVLKGIFKSVRGDGLGVEREEGDRFALEALEHPVGLDGGEQAQLVAMITLTFRMYSASSEMLPSV